MWRAIDSARVSIHPPTVQPISDRPQFGTLARALSTTHRLPATSAGEPVAYARHAACLCPAGSSRKPSLRYPGGIQRMACNSAEEKPMNTVPNRDRRQLISAAVAAGGLAAGGSLLSITARAAGKTKIDMQLGWLI